MKYYSKGIVFLFLFSFLVNGCAKKPEQEKIGKNDTIKEQITAKEIIFTKEKYDFKINRDYEQVRSIIVKNNDNKPRRFKTRIKDHDSDLALGFVGEGSGDNVIELSSGEERPLEFVLHAQDAGNEKYEFVIDVTDADTGTSFVDSAKVSVTVHKVNFDLDVSKGEVDPLTLTTDIKIVNNGDKLTDFTIQADDKIKDQLRFYPQVTHAHLSSGQQLKVEVSPVLFIGMKGFSGNIIISGAGKKMLIPMEFNVPEGKNVYCAVTRSTCSVSGNSQSCTNRGNIKSPMYTGGNGPINGPGPLPPDSPYRDGYLGENDGPPPRDFDWTPIPEDQSAPPPIKNKSEPPLRYRDSFPPIDYYKGPDGDYYNKNGDKLPIDTTPFNKNNSPFNKFKNKLLKLRKDYVPSPGAPFGRPRASVPRQPVFDNVPGLEYSNIRYPITLFGEDNSTVKVWHDFIGNNQEIFFAQVNEGELDKVTRLTLSEGDSRWPWIAGDINGELYVAWEDERDGAKREIYYKHSKNGGKDWSGDMRITDHGKGAYDPFIWVSGNDLILAWEDARGGIYMRSSSDKGKTWSEESRIAEGKAAWPQISGNKDDLWMAYEAYEGDGEKVYVSKSIDVGKTWSIPFEISSSSKQSGEPSILVLQGGSVCAAWRDNRDGESEIYFRKSNDGVNWAEEVRLTHDTVYSEYPFLVETEKGIELSVFAPVNDVNFTYTMISYDKGDTWKEPVRIPALEDNVEKVYFITNIKLPWDRRLYPKHNLHIKINGHTISTFEDIVPAEGQYIFEFDPTYLNYNPGGLAENIVEFDTNGLRGGNFFLVSNHKIIQSLKYQEEMLVTTSQSEADHIAETLFPEQINHDYPDIGIYANKVKGLPEGRNVPGKLTLEVEVLNIGAGQAEDIKVYIIKGKDPDGEKLGGIGNIDTIPGQSSRKVNFDLDYDGTCYMVTVAADCAGRDYDLGNNRAVFKFGYNDTGALRVLTEEECDVSVFAQATGKEVKKLRSNNTEALPIGIYKVVVHSEEERVIERVSIKGGEEALIGGGGSGVQKAKKLIEHPVKTISITEKETRLMQASMRGYLDTVQGLLKEGVDINARDDNGVSSLMYAAYYGKSVIVKYLLENGADVNIAQKGIGDTALYMAAQRPDGLELVRMLIEHNADVNKVCSDGSTPLIIASQMGHTDIVKYLHEDGADVNAKLEGGGTPLHLAAQGGHLKICGYLMDKGAIVDAKMDDLRTPLHIAAYRGRYEVSDLLVKHGADVNASAVRNTRPLHMAAYVGSLDIVKSLANNGADINAVDDAGANALSLAKARGNNDIVEYLEKLISTD